VQVEGKYVLPARSDGSCAAPGSIIRALPRSPDPPSAKGLTNYIDTETGAVIEFAVLLNGPDITEERKFEALWLAFADRVGTYPAGPEPASVGPR
jgi:D-alanyl-D-alanine carboxypeptidase/D-alanyl-D-alanine-endopeptidase (penicillin-binding protein 4)